MNSLRGWDGGSGVGKGPNMLEINFLRRIADSWSQWKDTRKASFLSKWLKCGHSTIPFHHSIPVEHSTDSIPPAHTAM